MMCCSCSLLASSGLGGAFAGGLIPGTGPHLEKESGIKELKQYIPLADELIAKLKDLSVDEAQPVRDAFMVDRASNLSNLCTDFDTFAAYDKKVDGGGVFTLTGTVPMNEFVLEYLGGEDSIQKVANLALAKECPGMSD